MSETATIALVCAGLFIFSTAVAYVSLARPILWLRMGENRGNQQYEQRLLKDELFRAKNLTAGVFAVIMALAAGYGLVVAVPKLFA